MKKLVIPFLLIFILSSLLAACKEPEPLTQERLEALNCQPGDLPKKQTYQAVEPRPIPFDQFLEYQPTMYSSLGWNDIASTRQSFNCTILVYADVPTAQNALQIACNTLRPPFSYPDFGEISCQAGTNEVSLIFQKDVYLVWLWADYQGKGIRDVAKILDERVKP